MQENEFEKKVRGLMDDLEIAPSAPVWDYVEKRIPKSNRRRRFIAFFLLLAGFAVCGYFFYYKFSDNSTRNTIAAVPPQVITAEKSKDANTVNDNSSKTGAAASTNDEATHKTLTVVLPGKEKPLATIQNPPAINVQTTKEQKQEMNAVNGKIAETEDENIITAGKAETPVLPPPENRDAIVSETAKDNSSIDIPDKKVMVQPDTTSTVSIQTKDTAQQQTKQLIKPVLHNKKLQWGISAFYGKSDVVQNIADIGGAEKSYAWDGNLNTGSGNGNNINDSVRYDNQSKNVIARSAYSIGINIRKPLSARSSIITGIEFMHMNTQIQTGMPKDSTAVFYYNNSQTATRLENFYRPGIGSTRINKYTVIQVPVLFNYQLNKNSKLPLGLDAGLSVSRVIASNALVYDSYNLAYYENKDLLRKTQVHFLAGFNTSITFRNSSSLILGPQLQYGLTGLVKNNSSAQHFFAWGLHARYFIKK
jgi:Outer membrane protein beta-barrel domain